MLNGEHPYITLRVILPRNAKRGLAIACRPSVCLSVYL